MKSAKKKYDKEWRKKNKDKFSSIEARYRNKNSENIKLRQVGNKLKHLYGITENQYSEMLISQNGCCKICKTAATSFKKRLSVDHCHFSNRVRGLLCSNCNRGLGLLKDSPEILSAAIFYLKDDNDGTKSSDIKR